MSCPGDSTCRPGDTCFFGHSAPAGESHTAILQALNRWMTRGGEGGEETTRRPAAQAQAHTEAHTEAQAGESEETDNMADDEGAIEALRAENEALRAEIAAAKQANEAATAALNAVEQERRDQAWANTRAEHVPQGWLAREGAYP